MITTVTMNASVDKMYQVDTVQLNTIMRVRKVLNTAGGKGLNVARIISQTGEPVRAIGLLGGYNGLYIRSMLRDNGIIDDFSEISSETRSCINIFDCSTGKHTEFLEPGTEVSQGDIASFMLSYNRALQLSDVVTISGSVPHGTPSSFYGELIFLAKALKKQIILDTSGDLLVEGIKSKPTMIKPNRDEIAQLIGSNKFTRFEVVEAAKQIQRQGIEFVVVSLGKEGSLLVCDQGIFRASPPEINVANTVGCGDSMVAGLAVGLVRKMNPIEMLKFSTAISAASAMSFVTGHFYQDDFICLLTKVNAIKEQ